MNNCISIVPCQLQCPKAQPLVCACEKGERGLPGSPVSSHPMNYAFNLFSAFVNVPFFLPIFYFVFNPFICNSFCYNIVIKCYILLYNLLSIMLGTEGIGAYIQQACL